MEAVLEIFVWLGIFCVMAGAGFYLLALFMPNPSLSNNKEEQAKIKSQTHKAIRLGGALMFIGVLFVSLGLILQKDMLNLMYQFVENTANAIRTEG